MDLGAPRIGYKYLFEVYKITFSFRSVRSGEIIFFFIKKSYGFREPHVLPAP